MPPIGCTSKWRICIVRRPTSRTSANVSGRTSSSDSPPSCARAQGGELLPDLLVVEQLEFRLPVADALDALGVGLELLRFAHSEARSRMDMGASLAGVRAPVQARFQRYGGRFLVERRSRRRAAARLVRRSSRFAPGTALVAMA
jgi:hypothetical protein